MRAVDVGVTEREKLGFAVAELLADEYGLGRVI
jgi:hypothetical protein